MTNEMLKRALRASATEEFKNININSETIIWEPSKQFNAEMEQLIAETTHSRRMISFKRVLLVAAVVLLIAVTAVFSSASVRNRVIQFFTQNLNDHANISYGYDKKDDVVIDGSTSESNIPDFSDIGYTMVSTQSIEHAYAAEWENGSGETLIFQQGSVLTERAVDNETLVRSDIVKNGVEIICFRDEGYCLLLWNTDNYTYSIDYYGGKNTDELLELLSCANLF